QVLLTKPYYILVSWSHSESCLHNLDRLPTRTRIASWGHQIDTSCCLCSNYPETRDHIFLHCDFSEQLWTLVMRRFYKNWTDSKKERYGSKESIRNARLHSSPASTPQVTFRKIDRLIRQTIIARKSRKKFQNLLGCWLKHSC
ncbi:hypothetical protein HID58_006676, partial [Brassica napus]